MDTTGDVAELILPKATVVDGRFVFDEQPGFEYGDDFDTEASNRTRDAIIRLYGHEKFHGHIVRLLGWVGRKKGLQSLQIDPGDEDFAGACEVVHRRLMDGPFGDTLSRLGDQALEDVIVCLAGFGPVFWAASEEMRQRKKAAVSSATLRKRNEDIEQDGGDDD